MLLAGQRACCVIGGAHCEPHCLCAASSPRQRESRTRVDPGEKSEPRDMELGLGSLGQVCSERESRAMGGVSDRAAPQLARSMWPSENVRHPGELAGRKTPHGRGCVLLKKLDQLLAVSTFAQVLSCSPATHNLLDDGAPQARRPLMMPHDWRRHLVHKHCVARRMVQMENIPRHRKLAPFQMSSGQTHKGNPRALFLSP